MALKKLTGILAASILAIAVTSCSKAPAENAATDAAKAPADPVSAADTGASAEEVNDPDKGAVSGGTTASDTGTQPAGGAAEKESLAKRMTGKYSFDTEDDDPENDKCLIMNVVEFGDNLYAYCGEAMKDDGQIEAYSFWATEFIPLAAGDMSAKTSDSAKVCALNFSIMSNVGRYWDSGREGTIALTDGGLLFEGFGNDGFLCGDAGEQRLFSKDDSIEDAFPYVTENGSGGDDALQGLWSMEGDDAPIYLDFRGSDLTVYKKSPSAEVDLLRFGCEFAGGSFTGRGNALGYGSMPYEISVKYSIDGDRLNLSIDGDTILAEMTGELVLTRAEDKDIHVIAMDEVVFNEDSFGYYGKSYEIEDLKKTEYYGVFLSAFENPDDCADTESKLEEAGYMFCPVVYTPDFSELNPKPYYCVTAGLFTTQEKAEEVLADIKKAGFADAYVKNAGRYIGDTMQYLDYGSNEIEVLYDRVILRGVSVSIPYVTDADAVTTDLFVYKDAVFDSSAQMQYFGNYEKGDTPYEWIARNRELMTSDPDKYQENGPALAGVFEVSLDGRIVTAYYGSYWWD